jgi:hypothetical protein
MLGGFLRMASPQTNGSIRSSSSKLSGPWRSEAPSWQGLILSLTRSLAGAVNDFLEVERKRVPGQVLWDAERLEYLLFGGYDPGSHVKCGLTKLLTTGLSDSD